MLIVDVGNNHFGDIEVFKELIRQAHNSGADLIKGQAFKAEDLKNGSMQKEFYQQCELSEFELIQLVWYARSIGNDLFFSIFSEGFDRLRHIQRWQKIAGSQFRHHGLGIVYDQPEYIGSIPVDVEIPEEVPPKHAELLHVSGYLCSDPELGRIKRISDWLGRPAGYSDHHVGIGASIQAVKEYGAHIIEKHFTLDKNLKFGGKIFRDTVHAADPLELEQLAEIMSNHHWS